MTRRCLKYVTYKIPPPIHISTTFYPSPPNKENPHPPPSKLTHPTTSTLPLQPLPFLPARPFRTFFVFDAVDDVVFVQAGEKRVARLPALGAAVAVRGFEGAVGRGGWCGRRGWGGGL